MLGRFSKAIGIQAFKAKCSTSSASRIVTAFKNAAANNRSGIFKRFYSDAGVPSSEEIESRIIQILKGFDKVKSEKISMDADFNKDLGLDSLDTVEVIFAIEEDFDIEIPDFEADKMKSPRDAMNYVARVLAHPEQQGSTKFHSDKKE